MSSQVDLGNLLGISAIIAVALLVALLSHFLSHFLSRLRRATKSYDPAPITYSRAQPYSTTTLPYFLLMHLDTLSCAPPIFQSELFKIHVKQ